MAKGDGNFSAQARQIREGETISKVVRLPLDEHSARDVKRKLSSMRNSANQIATRAKEDTERDFRVETGQFIVNDATAIMLVVTITCMEDEGEDDI